VATGKGELKYITAQSTDYKAAFVCSYYMSKSVVTMPTVVLWL